MKTLFLGLVGLILVVGLFVYLSQTGGRGLTGEPTVREAGTTTPSRPATTTATSTSATTPQADDSDTMEIAVHGANYTFTPTTITVQEGQKVKLTFTSDSGLHDFVIDEIPGAKTGQLQAGKSQTIEFTASKKGTYEYYCSVGNHRAMGMKGTFIVQ